MASTYIFFLRKVMTFFSHRRHSDPLRLPDDRLPSVLYKFSRTKFLTFIRMPPLDGVTRGGPLPPLPPRNATAHLSQRNRAPCSLRNLYFNVHVDGDPVESSARISLL